MQKIAFYFGPKLLIFFAFVIMLFMSTCIDPFTPKIDNFESLLVVDALLTDEPGPYYVKLTNTSETGVGGNENVITGATIFVSDDFGNVFDYHFDNLKNMYLSNDTSFRGEVGRTYVLHILYDGKEYLSNPSLMYPKEEIDTIYYVASSGIPDGYENPYDGLDIFIETKAKSEAGFRRWSYDEWWKFKVPYPATSVYYSSIDIRPIEQKKEVCWANEKSLTAMLHNDSEFTGDKLTKKMLFVPSSLTNRFQIQYSIEVTQYSLSMEEYDFWARLESLDESTGDIFGSQPYLLQGNMYNPTDDNENVLGYFRVSGVSKKQMYITYDDIRRLELPKYYYPCALLYFIESSFQYFTSWDDITRRYTSSGYTFVACERDTYDNISGMYFVENVCADCTMKGVLTPPSFWVDL